MVDLSDKESHRYWKNHPENEVYRTILSMESVEHWTLDGNLEFEEVIAKFSSILEGTEEINIQNEIIKLFSHLKFGRAIRLLDTIDSSYPGAATEILRIAENTANSKNGSGLFLKRILTFERLRMLARVFSEVRLEKVSKILEGNSE